MYSSCLPKWSSSDGIFSDVRSAFAVFRDRAAEEGDEEAAGLRSSGAKRIRGDHFAQLVRRAEDDLHLHAALLADAVLDAALQHRAIGFVAAEDDVAALKVGLRVAQLRESKSAFSSAIFTILLPPTFTPRRKQM